MMPVPMEVLIPIMENFRSDLDANLYRFTYEEPNYAMSSVYVRPRDYLKWNLSKAGLGNIVTVRTQTSSRYRRVRVFLNWED